MLLYPRLPQAVAGDLALERSELQLEQLRELSDLAHPSAIFSPTGGSRVDVDRLVSIQDLIRQAASVSGYPVSSKQFSRSVFDAESARILYEKMNIHPSEASSQGVWAFIACILLPDIVRWRFPGSGGRTTTERFLGSSRGMRNTFGRVWWRAFILLQPNAADPYFLLDKLGEDELVQIMERPNLSGNPQLARSVAQVFLENIDEFPANVTRSDLLRDVMKRLRRLFPIMSFEAMEEYLLASLLNELFEESIHHLST